MATALAQGPKDLKAQHSHHHLFSPALSVFDQSSLFDMFLLYWLQVLWLSWCCCSSFGP
jgi:hypothetical protein